MHTHRCVRELKRSHCIVTHIRYATIMNVYPKNAADYVSLDENVV